MPEVSIIIPTKNEQEYLPKLLDSIKLQGVSDLEIIVAISPQTEDRTAKIALDYGCRVVEGGPLAFARNSGAREAGGNILLFIDADVILPENFLAASLKEFNERGLDVAGTLQTPIKTGSRFNDFQYKFFYESANRWMRFWQRGYRPFMQVCMFSKKKCMKKLAGLMKISFLQKTRSML